MHANPVGHGLDGKTLVFGDLLSAVWEDSCGSCSGTMLQIEREIQKQGHNFIDAAFLSFDEADRERGTQEALMKMFLGNLLLPLRKNHEPETSHCSSEIAGKAWCVNMKDIPFTPSAKETSHVRRYRGIFHRAELTNDDARVDEEKRIYKLVPEFRAFARSGLAAFCFALDALIPTEEFFSPEEFNSISDERQPLAMGTNGPQGEV